MTSINICHLDSETYGKNTSTTLPTRGRRRVFIFITGTIAKDTSVDLASFIPDLTDIEGALYFTRNNAIATTALTWSGTTLTMSSEGATSRAIECGVMGRYL